MACLQAMIRPGKSLKHRKLDRNFIVAVSTGYLILIRAQNEKLSSVLLSRRFCARQNNARASAPNAFRGPSRPRRLPSIRKRSKSPYYRSRADCKTGFSRSTLYRAIQCFGNWTLGLFYDVAKLPNFLCYLYQSRAIMLSKTDDRSVGSRTCQISQAAAYATGFLLRKGTKDGLTHHKEM